MSVNHRLVGIANVFYDPKRINIPKSTNCFRLMILIGRGGFSRRELNPRRLSIPTSALPLSYKGLKKDGPFEIT